MSLSWLGATQTELINRQIADKSPQGAQQAEFIQAMISEFEGSEAYKFMSVAQRYYENDPDIRDKKRTVIGKDMENNAILKESKVLSNNKLQHNFLKKLTRQKIGYMLGKPFTLTAVKADDEKAKKFFEAVQRYLDMPFFKFIKNVARDSIVKGIAWVQVYYNEVGELKIRRCAPEEVIPLWADSDHTILEAVIHPYKVEQYTGANKKTIKYVEYYTRTGVYYYVVDDTGRMIPNPDVENNPGAHFYLKPKDAETEQPVGTNWAEIPFIPFKYDPDEQSLLSRIKSLVDDYDKKTSSIADNIDDHPNSVTVVKNYDGSSKEEFVQNKNEYRTIFVQGDGDARALETSLNVADIDKHIERLRQDIYEFGQGVDAANKDIRDTSGVALRFIYADLDMDCVDWGGEVKWSLMKLIWFMQQDLFAKEGTDYTDVSYDVVFNTDVIINESETILNCMNSVGRVSDKTIAANHPWTLDADKELESIKKDMEETYEMASEYGNSPNSGSGEGKSSGSTSGK